MTDHIKLAERPEEEPLHIMHDFGRKCDHCGQMTWPGMPGAATNWTDDRVMWRLAPNRCTLSTNGGGGE